MNADQIIDVESSTMAPAEPPVDPPPDPPSSGLAPVAEEPGAVASMEALQNATGQLSVNPDVSEFYALCQMAGALAKTGVLPDALRNKPADVMAILLVGRSLNIDHMTALRMCHVINGAVSIAPKLRLVLLNNSGQGSIRKGEVTGETATAIGYDRHGEEIGRETYTMADARAAKLADKFNWKAYPKRMLWWRAVGYLLDDLWPQVGMGLYSPDELGAMTDEDGEAIDVDSVEIPKGLERQERSRQNQSSQREPEPAKIDPATKKGIDDFTVQLKALDPQTDEQRKELATLKSAIRDDWMHTVGEAKNANGHVGMIGTDLMSAEQADQCVDMLGHFAPRVAKLAAAIQADKEAPFLDPEDDEPDTESFIPPEAQALIESGEMQQTIGLPLGGDIVDDLPEHEDY